MNDKLILGIESSCDETSAAIVKNGRFVLSEITTSQIDIHSIYGGVVPELASRNHLHALPYAVDGALRKAGLTLNNIDAVGVTYGPGLVGALLTGLSFAKALAYASGKTLIGVHHIKGHIAANYLQYHDLKPPFLSLIVSGGHTTLAVVKDYCDIKTLGKTMDDAAGEAFDKIARTLGLAYPGGPEIDKCAKLGKIDSIAFPRAMLDANSLDFSFSGLKSAVLNYLNTMTMRGEKINIFDVSASFQEAAVDVLCAKTNIAAQKTGLNTIALSGGVAANSRLKERMRIICEQKGYELFIPDAKYCTDNASMIASSAYYELMCGNTSDIFLNATANLPLDKL